MALLRLSRRLLTYFSVVSARTALALLLDTGVRLTFAGRARDLLTQVRGHRKMGIGSGIFLFVVGAILAFAINVQVDWANLDMIGYLLMGAGAVVFLVSLVLVMRKRSSTETVRQVDSAGGERVTQRENRSTDNTTDPLV
jgi:Domain of unknown function (DUF6458)